MKILITIALSVLSHFSLATLLSTGLVINDAWAGSAANERVYFKLAKVRESEEHDLDIVSAGMFKMRPDGVSFADLTRIESELNGDAWTLDFGGGYNYQGLYFAFGVALGRNTDTDDNLFAYYPEVGVALDVTRELAASISLKRYHRLYSEDEGIVMIGLLIRQ